HRQGEDAAGFARTREDAIDVGRDRRMRKDQGCGSGRGDAGRHELTQGRPVHHPGSHDRGWHLRRDGVQRRRLDQTEPDPDRTPRSAAADGGSLLPAMKEKPMSHDEDTARMEAAQEKYGAALGACSAATHMMAAKLKAYREEPGIDPA